MVRPPEWAIFAAEFLTGLAKALSDLHHHLRLPGLVLLPPPSILQPLLSRSLQINPALHLSICFQEDPADTLNALKSVMPPFYAHPNPKPAIGLPLTFEARVLS